MKRIDLSRTLPTIDGNIGYYYDQILTQYAIAWELKKAIKEHGLRVLARNQGGFLPLRETIEVAGNPLLDGAGRCAAMSISMLIVFERPGKGLWTIVCRRSKDVAANAGMMHVVPAGMFEARNSADHWSVQIALWREMLEEVYSEKEEQGDGTPGFEDYLVQKEPVKTLSSLIKERRVEFSLTGICSDLTYLQIGVCAVLLVRGVSLAEIRPMKLNWEYDLTSDRRGSFGIPWAKIEEHVNELKVGEITPIGAACLELGRRWLRRRHKI
jgi:hypothetical protein